MPRKKKTRTKLHWTQTPRGYVKLQKIAEIRKNRIATEQKDVEDKKAYQEATQVNACPSSLTPLEKVSRKDQFSLPFELQKIDSNWRLQDFMKEFFDKGVRLANKKNHDYAGTNDPFHNLRRFGMQGFIVRMGDKFARLETLATHGYLAVTEESYTDTLIDIANYAALLAAYLYNQRVEVEEQNAKSR